MKFSAFRIENMMRGRNPFQAFFYEEAGSYVHYNFYPAFAVGL